MSATEENVLVVPRQLFDELGAFEGLNFDVHHYIPTLLDPRRNFFLPRSAAENDPAHKQIIPYLLLRHGRTVLRYRRGKSGGEARLHQRFSLGIGGHINDTDTERGHCDAATYERAVLRELHEELVLETDFNHRIVALLNDDRNEVGRVHLGVVHVLDLQAPRVQARETAIAEAAFVDLDEIIREQEALEGWSQLCATDLARLVLPPARH